MSDLTDYELEELYRVQTATNKARMARLLDELRRLRDQAGEREVADSAEQEW